MYTLTDKEMTQLETEQKKEDIRDEKQKDIKEMFEVQNLDNLVCKLNIDEDSDDEQKNNVQENFIEILKNLHDLINSNRIDDLRRELQSNGNKFHIMKIHDEYRRNMVGMARDDLVKNEVDNILTYLGIPYCDLGELLSQ